MMFKDVIGLATTVVVVAFLSGAIYRGASTAHIIGALGSSFSQAVSTATLQGSGVGSS